MGINLPRQDLPSLFRTGRGSLEHPHLSRASGYLPTGVPGEPSRKRDLFRLRKNEPDQVLFLREKPTKCFESVNFFPKHAIIIGDITEEIMTEALIKSKHRVQKHGEVFTPAWMVQKMLDTPGVKEACENIYSTFLEPSAGDGNFLEAILERKLSAVTIYYNKRNWKTKSLFALSSIYGIEFLEDNLEVARSRMFLHYLDWYEDSFGERLGSNTDVYKSAHYLIKKNIVRGNTLTKRHPDSNELIMFSEWKRVKGYPSLVEEKRFAFAELFGENIDGEDRVVEGQLSLFEELDEDLRVGNTKKVVIQKVYTLGD